MAASFKELTGFFREIGAADVGHTNKTYLAHCIGVHGDMKKWGGDDVMCHAALFHSIYGTEIFQDFTLPVERRADVRALIGERAEYLAYVNCAMVRDTFDAAVEQHGAPYVLQDRLTRRFHRDERAGLQRLSDDPSVRLAGAGGAVGPMGLSPRRL